MTIEFQDYTLPWISDNAPPSAPGLLERLKAVRSRLPSSVNLNDLADALIVACLTEGIVTTGQIIAVLTSFDCGLKETHIRTKLAKGAGLNAARHFWRKEGKEFRLNERSAIFASRSAAHITVPARKMAVH